jgi:succinate-semialdehyde dehydrogenase / glutarate-semialdehyde dehydrogenase
MRSINPATGRLIAEYPDHDAAAVEERLARADATYRALARTGFDERAAWMRRAAAILRERSGRYAELMTLEMGKTIAAAEAEVEKCAWVCDFYAENAARFLADEIVETDAERSWISFQPIGAILAIMPWNFPFWQVFRFAAPALMAGNVGLLKHASNVPGSALAIEEVFRDAGFPDGAFQTLLVGSRAVDAIIADARVRAVTLTGSEGAGRSVGASAGRSIKKVVLELGGSDPFIVMPSADLAKAASTAVAARTINNGQSCIAAKRFIVHRDIAAEFERRFVEELSALRIGDPMDRDVAIGPLARPEFVDELHDQVERSVATGARIAAGGERIDGDGFFYRPTLLADVTPGMAAFDEETFGPVAALVVAESLDDAIALANRSRFGLGASAWTSIAEERVRFAREIEAGSVFINGMVKSDPRLPFGGVKASGVGRELAEFGIREFVNIKSIWVAPGTDGEPAQQRAE